MKIGDFKPIKALKGKKCSISPIRWMSMFFMRSDHLNSTKTPPITKAFPVVLPLASKKKRRRSIFCLEKENVLRAVPEEKDNWFFHMATLYYPPISHLFGSATQTMS